tara:strand:- start:2275 stop:3069 length:795 start_codon:yes stop_codon:yes gene_type:complete
MLDCCSKLITTKTYTNKQCIRNEDKKTFKLPRKYTFSQCKNQKGFSMKSSCAPFKFCENKVLLPKLRPIDNKDKKHKYKLKDPQKKRILAIDEGILSEAKKTGKTLKKAAISKKARFNILRIYRKNKKPDECRKITEDMRYINKKYGLGKTTDICKKSFLYNPNDPSKSFDVYINKNPDDTIPIKYKTLQDVKNTINKLEKLFKSDKYTHKRIWQVGMIMYVRLKVLKDKKKQQFLLSKKYFQFLGKRTKTNGHEERKKLVFVF